VQLTQIDLNLLVLLDALLETHSVKLAARRMALSPSAASHALGRLRDLLGDPILVRAGRQLVPSARAGRLRGELRQVLEDVQRLLGPDHVEPAELRRIFTLASNDYTETTVFPALSRDLATAAPGVDLHSRPVGVDPAGLLRSGDVDLFIGVLRVGDDLVGEPLFSDGFVCMLRRGHPALTQPWTAKRYAALQHVLIAPRGEPGSVVDSLLAGHGLERRVARVCTTFTAAPHLVAGSDYVLTVSERMAAAFAAQLDLEVRRPPLELPRFTVVQAWHRRVDADPAHRWLRGKVAALMGPAGAATQASAPRRAAPTCAAPGTRPRAARRVRSDSR
jgi:DNA-binding transcriptional LysR family regulator